MSPLVTISLPCFNAAATLADTLRSVWAQTFQDWELVAVDDGSTDGTLDMLRALADPRVVVLADGRNRGRPARLNQVTALARGRYLARLDADDLMFPDRLQRQVEFLDANPAVDLVGGAIVSVDMATRPRGVRAAPARVASPARILAGEVLYHPAVTGRTEWFRQHPYLDEYRYSDDFALWASAARTLRLANLAEPVLFYREHGQFTHAKFCARIVETHRALRRFGPPAVGRFVTAALLARRGLKNAVYHGLHGVGLWNWTLRLSNRGLTAAAVTEFATVIERIRRQPVPGLKA